MDDMQKLALDVIFTQMKSKKRIKRDGEKAAANI